MMVDLHDDDMRARVLNLFPNWDLSNIRFNYSMVPGSESKAGHPHASEGSRFFSAICYGTNPFNNLIRKGFKTPSEFTKMLYFLLLWLQTGNASDWYSMNISPEFNKVQTAKDPQQIASEVSKAFASMHKYIDFLYTVSAAHGQGREIETDDIRKLDDFHEDLCGHSDILELLIKDNASYIPVEVFSCLEAINIMLNRSDQIVDEEYIATAIVNAFLPYVYSTMYAAMLLAQSNAGNFQSGLNTKVLRNILVYDLMKPISRVYNGIDPVKVFNANKTSADSLKRITAPYVMRQLLFETRFSPDWVREYLPEKPLYNELFNKQTI